MNKKLFLGIVILAYVCILTAGLTSQLYLGDEVYHYRFAKDAFKLGKRAIFDSIFESGNPPGYFYNTSFLWPYMLAKIWHIFGNISFPVAQVYHSLYFLLLVLFTYLLAKDLYNKEHAIYSTILLITMPMIVVFSIIFYMDIPGTALSTVSLWLFFRKKIFLSGLIMGLAYLTKNNSIFLVPGIILIILFYYKKNNLLKLKDTIIFLLPIIFIFSQDTAWKAKHINTPVLGIDLVNEQIKIKENHSSLKAKSNFIQNKEIISRSRHNLKSLFFAIKNRIWNVLMNNYKNFNSNEGINITSIEYIKYLLQYLGIAFLLLLFLYCIFIKKNLKQDQPLLFLITSYVIINICIVDIKDIRYWFPVIILLVIIISYIFIDYRKRYFKIIIFVICTIQFFASLIYINIKRHTSQGIKQGFEYIKNNTPHDVLILYPGYILSEITDRKFVWSQIKWSEQLRISNLFWPENIENFIKIIKLNNINYIAIPKFRIYDDSKMHHFGGYPRSFVERLPKIEFMKLVFENKEISVWKVVLK